MYHTSVYSGVVLRSSASLDLDRCHKLTYSFTHNVMFSFVDHISVVYRSIWMSHLDKKENIFLKQIEI